MKVVFLCQRVPYPPDRGDRITTWHFLRHLVDRGAEVRLGCFAEEPRDTKSVIELAGTLAQVCAPPLSRRQAGMRSLIGLAKGRPLTLPFFHNRLLAATVRNWLREVRPDLVYVYSSSMAQYVLDCDTPDRGGPRRVMQFAELDSDKWRQFAAARRNLARWIYAREARRLLAFEARVARSFDLSLVVSEAERELFEERIPGVRPVVLPNGVDVDHFTSSGDDRREPHTVIFTGVMDYEPNVDGVLWFAETCWPAIRERFPDARFLVVGSRPAPRVQALAEHPGIEVTGRVPETPPWFDRASVAVAPLRLARGVQNKVLEAMAMGLPVVSSPAAVRGIGDVGPDALSVAAEAEETTTAVCDLLADPEAGRAMGRRAAEFVRSRFRWEHMYTILDRELLQLGLPPAGAPPEDE